MKKIILIVVISYLLWYSYHKLLQLAEHDNFFTKRPPQARFKIIKIGNVKKVVLISEQNKMYEPRYDKIIPGNNDGPITKLLNWIGGIAFMGITDVEVHKTPLFEVRSIKDGLKTGKKESASAPAKLEENLETLPLRFFFPYLAEKIEDQNKLHMYYFLNPEFEVVKPITFSNFLDNNGGSLRNITTAYNSLLIFFSAWKSYSNIADDNLKDSSGNFQQLFFALNGELEKLYGIKLIFLGIEDVGLDDDGVQIELSQLAARKKAEGEASVIEENFKTDKAAQAILTTKNEMEAKRLANQALIELAEKLAKNPDIAKYLLIRDSSLTTYVESGTKSNISL